MRYPETDKDTERGRERETETERERQREKQRKKEWGTWRQTETFVIDSDCSVWVREVGSLTCSANCPLYVTLTYKLQHFLLQIQTLPKSLDNCGQLCGDSQSGAVPAEGPLQGLVQKLTDLLTGHPHISLHSHTHYIAWWDWSAHSTHLSAQSNTLHSMMGLICSQHTSLCSQTHYTAWWDSSAHSTHLCTVKHITQHDGTHLFTGHISLHSQTHYTAWWDSSAHSTHAHLSAQSNTLHSMMGLICSQHTSLCTVKHIT